MNIKEKINNMPDKIKFYFKVGGALIVIIILIVIISAISNGVSVRPKGYAEIEATMVKAATKYVANNSDLITAQYGEEIVSVSDLVTAKYMKDLSSYAGKDSDCGGYVIVFKNDGNYSYSPKLDCGEDYTYKTLSDHIIDDSTVTSGNGLYKDYDNSYIFKGDSVKNYVSYANQLWRIMKVEKTGDIRLIQNTATNSSVSWDNRYNIEVNERYGINQFEREAGNSRLKDAILNYYNTAKDFTADVKSLIVPQQFCVGARTAKDHTTDGSTECKKKSEIMSVGGMIVSEYLSASLDPTCIYINSKGCTNYNYFTSLSNTFWLITPNKANSYEAYTLSQTVNISKCSNSYPLRLVLNLNGDINYAGGTGTKTDPYIVKANI